MNKKTYLIGGGIIVLAVGIYFASGALGKRSQDMSRIETLSGQAPQPVSDADVRGRLVSVGDGEVRIAQSEQSQAVSEEDRAQRRIEMQQMSEEERARVREERQAQQAAMPQHEIIISTNPDTEVYSVETDGVEQKAILKDIPEGANMDIWLNDAGNAAKKIVFRLRNLNSQP